MSYWSYVKAGALPMFIACFITGMADRLIFKHIPDDDLETLLFSCAITIIASAWIFFYKFSGDFFDTKEKWWVGFKMKGALLVMNGLYLAIHIFLGEFFGPLGIFIPLALVTYFVASPWLAKICIKYQKVEE